MIYEQQLLIVETLRNANGYITWHRATGDNVELLHLKVSEPRHGTGTYLLRQMLHRLQFDPPYATVFGFTRVSNTVAQSFYKAMGFELTTVKGVYADGQAVVFSQNFKELLRIHNVA